MQVLHIVEDSCKNWIKKKICKYSHFWGENVNIWWFFFMFKNIFLTKIKSTLKHQLTIYLVMMELVINHIDSSSVVRFDDQLPISLDVQFLILIIYLGCPKMSFVWALVIGLHTFCIVNPLLRSCILQYKIWGFMFLLLWVLYLFTAWPQIKMTNFYYGSSCTWAWKGLPMINMQVRELPQKQKNSISVFFPKWPHSPIIWLGVTVYMVYGINLHRILCRFMD